MRSERRVPEPFGWLISALLFATSCNGPSGSASDAAAPAGSAASAPSAASSPIVAQSPPTAATGSATPAVPAGDLTSPVTTPVPSIKEAVVALTRKIAEYGGHLGVAVLDVQSGELVAAQNDRRPLNPASN